MKPIRLVIFSLFIISIFIPQLVYAETIYVKFSGVVISSDYESIEADSEVKGYYIYDDELLGTGSTHAEYMPVNFCLEFADGSSACSEESHIAVFNDSLTPLRDQYIVGLAPFMPLLNDGYLTGAFDKEDNVLYAGRIHRIDPTATVFSNNSLPNPNLILDAMPDDLSGLTIIENYGSSSPDYKQILFEINRLAVLDESQAMVEELVEYVMDLNIREGISNSLDSKLEAVLNALDDLNAKNDVAAINSLEAFINAVEAQRGKAISEEEADELIAQAQAIIDILSSYLS